MTKGLVSIGRELRFVEAQNISESLESKWIARVMHCLDVVNFTTPLHKFGEEQDNFSFAFSHFFPPVRVQRISMTRAKCLLDFLRLNFTTLADNSGRTGEF